MPDPRRLGALLVGIGLGILVFRLFPWAPWLWPLGLIVGGLMVWRRLGTPAARLIVLALSLTAGLLAVPSVRLVAGLSGETGRVVATYHQTGVQQQEWLAAERVEIVNGVGSVLVRGGADELAVSVEYRRHQRGGRVPAELQVQYDPHLRTLTVVGIDPELAQAQQRGLSAQLELQLPERLELHVTSGVGDVTVSRLRTADIHSEVGRIKVKDISEALQVHSDVGGIDIENVAGEVTAVTRVGEIKLMFDHPVAAAIVARTDVGDVQLVLPSGSNTTVRAVSQIRNVAGDLEQITASEGRLRLGTGEHEVELRTRVGEVKVKQR